MLIVGAFAIGLAIVLIVYLAGSAASSRVTAAATSPAATPVVSAQPPSGLPVPRSGIDPNEPLPALYRRFGAIASRLTPSGYGRTLQRQLDLAGNPAGYTPERVLAFKGIFMVGAVVLGVVLGVKHGAGVIVFPIIGGALGFFVPDLWVHNLGEHRQENILLGLPDAIDMMTVCVEAGLGFDAALARVARNLEGPMAEETARVLQEMQFGKSRTEALRSLVDRTDVSELRTFVSALIQSSDLGISVGEVLREQARQMRIRRRQRAEEKAQKLPVRILFPLLLCMLPAMFVVVLGPAVIRIVNTLGGLTHG